MLQVPFAATQLEVATGVWLSALHLDTVNGYVDGPGSREEVDSRVMEVLVAFACQPV